MLNLITNYKIRRNWNIAARWRFIGGVPYSPIDETLSKNRAAWNITHQPYLDYDNYNSLRLASTHSLDLRVDKEFYFDSWVLNLYIDVQNAYDFRSQRTPIYTNIHPKSGEVMTDPDGDPTKQDLRILVTEAGRILTSVGIIVKF